MKPSPYVMNFHSKVFDQSLYILDNVQRLEEDVKGFAQAKNDI